MANKLYYVNGEDKVALFYGEYNSEPDVNEPNLKSWLACFGPARPLFVTRDSPPVYPWSDGRTGVNAMWKLWLVYPGGRHSMKPSGPWQAWPMHTLDALASTPGFGYPQGRKR